MANDGPLSVGDLAASVVAQDPELRNELRALVQDIVGNMRYVMRHGDPASKLQLTKAIVPQLLGAINKVEKSAEKDEQRAAYERMMSAVRGDGVGRAASGLDATGMQVPVGSNGD